MAKLGEVCYKESSNIAQKDLENHNGIYPIFGASGLIKYVDFYQQENPYIAVVKDGAGVGRIMKLPAKSSVIGTMQYILPKPNINLSFLAYAMENMNLAKYYTGATIPHIYFKDYQKEEIPLPPLEEQQKIAAVLDKVTDLIDKRKQQLAKLDELIKSRFVEMFGNPVTNEKKWDREQLKNLTIKIGSGSTPKGGKESYHIEGISLIRSLNVHNGKFEYKDLAYIDEVQAKQLNNVIVEEQDVLLNITGASVARSCVVPKNVLPARVNQHVTIIRCKIEQLNPIFLNQQLLNASYQNFLIFLGESNGATRQALTKEQIENFYIIIPPLDLQNQFAEFVEQTEKTNVAINHSLDKLETLKKALMQKYFG